MATISSGGNNKGQRDYAIYMAPVYSALFLATQALNQKTLMKRFLFLSFLEEMGSRDRARKFAFAGCGGDGGEGGARKVTFD